jgi:hypothetical protein
MRSTKPEIERKQLNIRTEFVLFRDIEESPLNAQEMKDKEFNRLVKNIKRDGCLTSTPLLMDQSGKQKKMCISGHHRIKAAIKAGLDGAMCMVSEELDETTRIRIQLAHNDIHGESNKEVLIILQQSLSDIDFSLVETTNVETSIKELEIKASSIPEFRHINICLLETSRDRLVEMIMSLENSQCENWLIEKEEYEHINDLLSYAFDRGFKTPGQAFGKFLDIIEQNKELITR